MNRHLSLMLLLPAIAATGCQNYGSPGLKTSELDLRYELITVDEPLDGADYCAVVTVQNDAQVVVDTESWGREPYREYVALSGGYEFEIHDSFGEAVGSDRGQFSGHYFYKDTGASVPALELKWNALVLSEEQRQHAVFELVFENTEASVSNCYGHCMGYEYREFQVPNPLLNLRLECGRKYLIRFYNALDPDSEPSEF